MQVNSNGLEPYNDLVWLRLDCNPLYFPLVMNYSIIMC